MVISNMLKLMRYMKESNWYEYRLRMEVVAIKYVPKNLYFVFNLYYLK